MNVRLAFFCLSFWMVLGSNGFAQDFCSSFTVTVSEDTTICEPSSPVQLSASFSSQPFFVEWSPAPGLDNPLSAQPIATTPTTETYTVTAQAISENLIFNGDFELGGLGFTTDYNIASGGPNGPLHNEGEYLVSDNPNATHQDFADCGDHTLGTGNMMVVNSSDQQNDIWCQVISVEPGENYAFSAWVASVTSENPANLQFSFDGNLLGNTVEAPEETCVWTPFFATWSSGTATDVEICIANVNNESTGNDFAIDDIRFGPICEADASVTITVGEAPLPVPEVDCNATANSIALSWDSVAGASSYSITVLDAAPGVFTSDTSYLITGLSELQQVNYELFAVSADGCSSQVFSGSCFSLECPEYSLTLDGDNEICEGDSLTLTLEITTSGSGPFSVGYEFNGLANTLQGLQPGTNTLSLPVPIGGTLSLSALTDESAPSCTFNGTFPSLSFTVIPGGNAGVGADLTFCSGLDSLLNLTEQLNGADLGGTWSVLEGEVSDEVLDGLNAGMLNLGNISSGNYQLGYIIDNGVCDSDTAVFSFEILETPQVPLIGPFSLDCETTEIEIGTTAVPGLNYSWIPLTGGMVSDPAISNPTTTIAGDYVLVVTDPVTGCANLTNISVLDNTNAPDLAISTISPSCDLNGLGEIRVDSVTGGQAPFLYSIDNGSFQQSSVFSNLQEGSYEVRVQDAGGCEGVAIVELTGGTLATISLVAPGLGALPTIFQGDTLSLAVQTTDVGGILPDSLIWAPEVCMGCSEVTVTPLQTTTYQVTGITADGCTVSASIVVEVSNMQRIYVPNAFSPNDDGVNDVLFPFAGPEFIRGESFRIFNRWGSLVYELNDFMLQSGQQGWDGVYKGEPSPGGVYGYHLILERSNGSFIEETGEINLIR